MPKPNDHSFDLKNRLVGAAVLIIAAVLILLLVLISQKQGYRHALIGNGHAVMPIQQTFISRIEVDSSDAAVQQSSGDVLKEESRLEKQSGKEQFTNGVKDQRSDVKRPGNDSNALSSGWVVRVGVFQIVENAKNRQSLLDQNGFSVNLEEAKLDGKTAIRVFLGPFQSEDEAERMKVQAVMVTNDKAFVARYP